MSSFETNVDAIRQEILEVYGDKIHYTEFLYPDHKREIAQLSHAQKLEWYAYQFQKNPYNASIVLSTPEFKRFWKWRVLMPMKLKRLYYRVKNGEIFRKYQHISEMKEKVKKHSI